MNRLPRTGIMFSAPFPTLADADRDASSSFLIGAGVPDELAEWLAVSYDPRGWSYSDEDAEAMDETNFDAIRDAVTTDAELGVPEVRCDYRFLSNPHRNEWVVSGVEDALEAGVALFGRVLIVAPDNADAIEAAEECERALADYPLLDESAYSERDWDAWQEYAPMAYGDEIRDAVRSGAMTDEVADQLIDAQFDLLPALAEHLHYNSGFTGEYGPNFLEILGTALSGLFPRPPCGQQ